MPGNAEPSSAMLGNAGHGLAMQSVSRLGKGFSI